MLSHLQILFLTAFSLIATSGKACPDGFVETALNCSRLESSCVKSASFKSPVLLQCEYGINPYGIDVEQPALSWMLQASDSSLRNLTQYAYQILVASTRQLLNQDVGDLWDSKKNISTKTNAIIYAGKALRSHQTVYWKVRVWDQDKISSAWSSTSQWTMGILKSMDWSGAKWIGAPATLDSAVNSTFLLRYEFSVRPALKRALLSICGLGQYEMTVNGNHVTESVLNPGWTQYNKTCLYDTHDITALVKNGQNAFGILLSNGMYRVKKDGRYAKFEHSFGRLQAIAKIQFEYDDGSVSNIITDEHWKAGISPMIWSSIYGGEDWDERKVQKGWNEPGFNDSSWFAVEPLNGPGGALKGVTHAALAIRKFQVYKPVSSKEIKSNVAIYDLGQQASFISSFTAKGPAGSVIKITPSELLNTDGTLFRNNYNGKSYSQFTLVGGLAEERYTSKFFNTGCRYYQVECLPAPGSSEVPTLVSIDGTVIHSDNASVGEFSCSNELFNQAYKMIQWAEVSNMKSVISDCPHRERLGWLEQDHLHGPSFRYTYDMRPLARKIIADMNDTQQANGLVPCIAPELTTFGADWREAIEWGSAAVLLPWQQYVWTGDREVLRHNYAMMKSYVEYLKSTTNDGIAPVGKGDWEGRRTSPNTPKDLVSTAFYYENVNVLVKSATLLEKKEESVEYEILAKNIYEAFNKKFFNADTKQYGTGSQCSNALALVMGLVDPSNRQAVLNNLVADLENEKYENTTGEVGWRYVLRALADGGRSDVVYKMNNQTEKPGYGYQLKAGATALPETWDAYRDNSQNQFMLGHIVEWFYHDLAGIQMEPTAPGFKTFNIRPDVVGDLTEVKGSYNSIHGKIVSEWKRTGNKIVMHIAVPPNTTAMVRIPSKEFSSITEHGKPIIQIKEIKIKSMEGLYAIVQIGSGDYIFSSLLP